MSPAKWHPFVQVWICWNTLTGISTHFILKQIWKIENINTDISWWRHQMETFSALLALCVGNSPEPVNSPHKGQWRGALMFSLICAWINGWVNNHGADNLGRQRAHYDVIVMYLGAIHQAKVPYILALISWWKFHKIPLASRKMCISVVHVPFHGKHRPCSRQATERMECNFVIHPPPTEAVALLLGVSGAYDGKHTS